ncbi:hypothetical protein PTKIN_Ptkin09bG0214200 [Pterospermum kingtungense]
MQKGVSDVEDKTAEIKLLKATVSDREKETNWLKELVEKEKKRADLEKKKAAEASKHAETEKSKASEEHRLVEIERKRAEDYRTQLEALRKEVNKAKSKLASEKSKFDEATKQLQEEKKKAVEERTRADLEMAKAKEQQRIAEETKNKAVEERKHADLEMAKAEEQRKIAEEAMKKAVEVRKQAELEMAEAEQQRKIAEETKKAVEDKKSATVEMAKVEELRKIVEATKKKAVEDKSHADSLAKQLEEARRRNEELEKKLHELSGLRNLRECPSDQQYTNTSATTAKTNKRAQLEVLNEQADKPRAVSESLQRVEKEKVSERKRADSELRKAGKKRKLEEVNTKKAMDGNHCGDNLGKQLEDARLKIKELQKQINELSSSRNLVDALVVSDKGINAEVAEVKLLKKQLKFEKKRVKHAKDVARLEKGRSNLLLQEVGCMKLELIQFLNRLDALDKCFSTSAGGIDDMEKAGDIASMPWSKLKKKCSLKLCQTCLQTENQLLKTRCMDTALSSPLGETFQHAHFPPIQGGNCTESITGINSKLESLLGGSSRKMLRSSAINSSTESFSDRQLVGLQEKGAFSVTASAKLGEDSLNLQPSISSMSGEVTKDRCNENLAVVAENSVRSPLSIDPLGIVNGCGRKRKMILDAVESIQLLCSKSEKLHRQLDEKLSALNLLVKGQMGKPSEEAKHGAPNLQDIANTVHDGSRKRRKTSNKETVAMEQSCDGLQMNQMESCPENFCNPDAINHEIMAGFEEVVNKNYMNLLDLDDAADEECFRMASEMPVSPTLPVIEFPSIETFEVDQFGSMQDENFGRLSHENENVASSGSFDAINMENGSNKLQCTKKHSESPVVQVEMSVIPSSGDGVANISFESEIRSNVERIPKYCVVFSNIKDGSSVSRIFSATKTCMAQCSLLAQKEFVVHRILHALKLEEKLSPKEKVCVFFSLVLLNFGEATSGKLSLIRDYTPCLNLFAEHMNEVMSDAESRSLVAEICLDELLSVIEDFLIEGRLLYANLPSETSVECDSRIHDDGSNVTFSHKAATADLLVAGSIILGSICVAADRAGFMCEAAYSIFRMHRYDTSVVLVILHMFACVGGNVIFTLRNYSLTMTVLKSIVMFLESEHASVAMAAVSSADDAQPKFHACVGCPFSKDALSVDIVVSLLFAKLQNYTQSGIMHQDLTANLSNSSVVPIEDKAEQNLGSFLDTNCDVSCCLDKHSVPQQSGSVFTGTLCDISDVLSLLELLACNMSWDWTCKKIIPQLWSMLESSVIESFTVAIIIFLGQLGRVGVDGVGYEDKEVENLRVKFSAFLWQETTIRAGLPLQLATVISLLGLISLDFKKVIVESAELPVMSGQFAVADVIKNWFGLLTEEQRLISIRLFQSVN